MAIEKNSVVTLEYTLQDDKGNTIDSTDGRDAFSYIHGSNALFPAFEAQLEGRKSGEQLSFTLSPEEAFGTRDERLMKALPLERFNTSDDIRVGMSFKTQQGDEEVEVIVVAADDKEVTIDAISFDVVITGVREAGSEELETGKVTTIDEIYSQ